jgi:hypothetical protein
MEYGIPQWVQAPGGDQLKAEERLDRHHGDFCFLTIWQNLSVHGGVLGGVKIYPLENKGNRERD